MYGFLRDVFRMILVIRPMLCHAGRPYRIERDRDYENDIIYYHNTLARLKQKLIQEKKVKKLRTTLCSRVQSMLQGWF